MRVRRLIAAIALAITATGLAAATPSLADTHEDGYVCVAGVCDTQYNLDPPIPGGSPEFYGQSCLSHVVPVPAGTVEWCHSTEVDIP